MSAVEEVPTVHNIEILLLVTNSVFPVCGFRNLTSLNIIYGENKEGLDFPEAPVTLAVARSPQLKELIIRNFNRWDCHDIRTFLGNGRTVPPLEHLSLHGIPISMPFPSYFVRSEAVDPL